MELKREELASYLDNLEPDQLESVSTLRSLLLECEPSLNETIDTGKWWGGLLVYTTPDGVSLYALGPRPGGKTTLHMMPYYMSTLLQSRHDAPLKRFFTGKSCLLFKHARDLPLDSIRDIFTHGGAEALKALKEREEQRKAKKKPAS